MNSVLEINGKKLHSIKDAMRVVSYSRDHITRLAREKKILATFIGKQWYINLESLNNYEHSTKLEQQVRIERLSAERKRALKVKQAVAEVAKRHDVHVRKARTSARVAASLVALVGLLSGVWLHVVGVQQLATVASLFSPTQPAPYRETTIVLAPVTFNEHVVTAYSQGHTTVGTQQFAATSTGVFLLPAHGPVTNPSTLVSDVVAVVETETGQAFIKVDANGVPYGEEIPFVVVPTFTNAVNE